MGQLEDARAEQAAAQSQAQQAENGLRDANTTQASAQTHKDEAQKAVEAAAEEVTAAQTAQRQAAAARPVDRAALAQANADLKDARGAQTQAGTDLAQANANLTTANNAQRAAAEANAAAQRRLVAAQNATMAAEQRTELVTLRARLDKQQNIKVPLMGVRAETKLGMDWKVKGHWYQYILGNWTGEWKGDSRKIVLGHSNSIHIGPKFELYTKVGKGQWIAGAEVKYILGWQKSTFTGYYRTRIFGAKTDIVLGAKIEEHIGSEVELGNARRTELMPSFLRKVRDRVVKSQVAKWTVSKEEVTSKVSETKYDTFKASIQSATEKFDSLKDTVTEADIEDRQHHESGDSGKITADTIKWTAANSLKLTAGGVLTLNKSQAKFKKGGDDITCKGKTTFRGGKLIWK